MSQDYTHPLYPAKKIPNYQKTAETEKHEKGEIFWITSVQTPDIAVYLPVKQTATGQAVVVCPGGGYGGLVYDREGVDIILLIPFALLYK